MEYEGETEEFEEGPVMPQLMGGELAEDGLTFQGRALFSFPNGDSYEGDFRAATDGSIFRQGDGIYSTKDLQTYEGQWENDFLMHTVTIRYPDGSFYRGPTSHPPLQYSGFGSYTFPDNSTMFCSFSNNLPSGQVWINVNGKVWAGETNHSCAYLLQINRFLPQDPQEEGWQ